MSLAHGSKRLDLPSDAGGAISVVDGYMCMISQEGMNETRIIPNIEEVNFLVVRYVHPVTFSTPSMDWPVTAQTLIKSWSTCSGGSLAPFSSVA